MEIKYPYIAICGLSCRLCPRYHQEGENKCGCKSEARMAVKSWCPIVNCAIKKKGVEFCWECPDNVTCDRWNKRIEFSRRIDSFKCYQTLESDVSFIREHGVETFDKVQKARENILKEMLAEFNEGRSKSYYCIAATVLEVGELENALDEAMKASAGLEIKGKARSLHSALDAIAAQKNYCLKLRK